MKPTRLVLLITFLVTAFMSHAQYLQWAKRIGGNGSDYGSTLHSDTKGNIYLGASFEGTVKVENETFTASNELDALFIKYDSTGQVIWAKQLSGAGNQLLSSIQTGSDGSVYVLGSFTNNVDADPSTSVALLTGKGSGDFFLSKYTADGDFVWAQPFGGKGIDYGNGLAVTSSSLYLTGSFSQSVAFDAAKPDSLKVAVGGEDFFLARFTLEGELKWVKTVGGNDQSSGEDVVIDSDENVYVTGFFHNTLDLDPSDTGAFPIISKGGRDVLVAKFDSSGTFQWGGSFGSPYNDLGLSIAINSQNNIAITGELSSAADVDFSANQKIISPNSSASADAFLVEYTSAGQLVWGTCIGGNSYESGNEVAFDKQDNLFVALSTQSSSIAFDKNGTEVYQAAAGSFDGIAVKYNAARKYIYSLALGSTGWDGLDGLCVDGQSNLYLTGYYVGSVDFDPQATTYTLPLTGPTDAYFVKYGDKAPLVTGLGEATKDAAYELFPNPFKNELRLQTRAGEQMSEVKIMDVMGNLVHKESISATTDYVVSLGHLPVGIYQVLLNTSEGTRAKKVVKE